VRVVLDTSVAFAGVFLPASAARKVVKTTIEACWEMVVSGPMLAEYMSVANQHGRPGRGLRERFMQLIGVRGKCHWVEPASIPDCPLSSQGDRHVALTAVAGGASYIFARNDKDFLRPAFTKWCAGKGIRPLKVDDAVKLLASQPSRFALPARLSWLLTP